MYIKRDYSQPFFGNRRRRRGAHTFRLLVGFGVVLGAFLLFVNLQFDRLQLVALDAVGMAPTPTPFASQLATAGYQLFLEGNLVGASQFFERAMMQQPENPDYAYEYGRTLIEMEEYSRAIQVGRNMMSFAPGDVRGYALTARAMVYNDQATDAIPVGINGMEISQTYAPLYGALAIAYVNIGRYQQALSYGEQAIDIDPLDPFAHRAYAYTLLYLGRFEEAGNELEQAVSLAPYLLSSYFELAAVYLYLEEDAMAVATYERILSLDPQNVKAFVRICAAYRKVGQFEQAENYCNDALALDPENAEAMRQIGEIRYSRRNYEGAIEMFDQCQASVGEISYEFIQCWYLRGLAHFYLDHCPEAWSDLQLALGVANEQAGAEVVGDNIREGLRLIVGTCSQYAGQAVPAAPGPTAIPPTPIGG